MSALLGFSLALYLAIGIGIGYLALFILDICYRENAPSRCLLFLGCMVLGPIILAISILFKILYSAYRLVIRRSDAPISRKDAKGWAKEGMPIWIWPLMFLYGLVDIVGDFFKKGD